MERQLREYMSSETFAEVIDALRDKGFVLPFRFAAISVNGAMDLGTFETGSDAERPALELLGQVSAGGLHAVPIHFLFVDARGEAARVLIDGTGEPQIIH